MRNCKPLLLVENDPVDAETTRKALSELGVANELIHKVKGEDALEYLRDENEIRPCVILLDLNMPGMSGLEFLEAIKSDEILKIIPMVILTHTDNEDSVTSCFGLIAAGYFVKPAEYSELLEVMRIVDRYWSLSRLPNDDT